MSTPAFKIGNVVRLKSGGPRMTVTDAEPGRLVGTTWFDDSQQQHGVFHPDALQLAEKERKALDDPE